MCHCYCDCLQRVKEKNQAEGHSVQVRTPGRVTGATRTLLPNMFEVKIKAGLHVYFPDCAESSNIYMGGWAIKPQEVYCVF